jgi:hypothetical protein
VLTNGDRTDNRRKWGGYVGLTLPKCQFGLIEGEKEEQIKTGRKEQNSIIAKNAGAKVILVVVVVTFIRVEVVAKVFKVKDIFIGDGEH